MNLSFTKQITQLEQATVNIEMDSISEYHSQVLPMLNLLDHRMAVLNRSVIQANIAQGQLTPKEGAAVLNVLYGIQGIKLEPGEPVGPTDYAKEPQPEAN